MEDSNLVSAVNEETVEPKKSDVDWVGIWAIDEDDRRDSYLQKKFNDAFGRPTHKFHSWQEPAQ